MQNINPIKKKISKKDQKFSIEDPSKLLSEYFNGVIIDLDKQYKHDT
tara:strand:+ start:707 stop:847 length:141 start_codon:yes stop_codon:yes gene_type:complete